LYSFYRFPHTLNLKIYCYFNKMFRKASWHKYFIYFLIRVKRNHRMVTLFVAEASRIAPNDHKVFWGTKEKGSLVKLGLEISPIDAQYYFATRAKGLRWYSYDELKELMDLWQTTTVIGYLPIRLVMLLAADAAEMNLSADAAEMRMAA
jgi:hypothetical protein